MKIIFQSLLNSIEKMSDQDSLLAKKWINDYLSEARPFSTPKFTAQNFDSRKDRCKSLVGGLPFVSINHPWPLCRNSDFPMQPILQIDMKEAGINLDQDFDLGLLQLWAVVGDEDDLAMLATDDLLLLRYIPVDDLDDDSPIDFPENSCWLAKKSQLTDESIKSSFPNLAEDVLNGKNIQWSISEKMFPLPDLISFENADENRILFHEVFGAMDEEVVTPEQAPDLYLGGHGGQAGGHDDPSSMNKLLVRFSDGVSLHVGVTYLRNKKGAWAFNAFFRYN